MRTYGGKQLCITCIKSVDGYGGYHNDPYFYGYNHYNGWGRYDRGYSSSGSGGSGPVAEASCGGGDEVDLGGAAAAAADKAEAVEWGGFDGAWLWRSVPLSLPPPCQGSWKASAGAGVSQD